MAINDHELILQFARGTEALTAIDELRAIQADADAQREMASKQHMDAVLAIRAHENEAFQRVLFRTFNALDGLTSQEVARDEYNDDDD